MQLQHHYKNTVHSKDVEQYAEKRLTRQCEKFGLENTTAHISHEERSANNYHIQITLSDHKGHEYSFGQNSETAFGCVDLVAERMARMIQKTRGKEVSGRRKQSGFKELNTAQTGPNPSIDDMETFEIIGCKH